MKTLLILLLFSFCTLLIGAQTEEKVLCGVVQDERTLLPLEGVSVILQSKDGKYMYDSALTDNQGRFTLRYTDRSDSLFLLISGFNIKSKRIPVAVYFSQGGKLMIMGEAGKKIEPDNWTLPYAPIEIE